MAYRDPEVQKRKDRERHHRRVAERLAAGLCPKCGKCGRNPVPADRRTCEPCAAKRRAADRARYAEARAAGLQYGGKPGEAAALDHG